MCRRGPRLAVKRLQKGVAIFARVPVRTRLHRDRLLDGCGPVVSRDRASRILSAKLPRISAQPIAAVTPKARRRPRLDSLIQREREQTIAGRDKDVLAPV